MDNAEKFLDQLQRLESRLDDINTQLSDPKVLSDSSQLKKLGRERVETEGLLRKLRDYKSALGRAREAEEIVDAGGDPEFVALAEADLEENQAKLASLEEEITAILFPADPNDSKGVIIEIRAGTGGDEAALFAAELFRMYTRYADAKGWTLEVLNSNETGIGGLKEIVFNVSGQGAYGKMKFESGVHRVQRVPETEASGRIHTSAATVAVLPEAEDVDVAVHEKDLRVDVYRSSGPGGQGVNTTDSAVRITHLPTGLVVTCQDERSQIKNRAKAMKILRSRLLDEEIRRQEESRRSERRSQVSTGDRSAKIRTYNFPQGRVTDHRTKLTLHRLQEVLEGDLDELVQAMATAVAKGRLDEVESEDE